MNARRGGRRRGRRAGHRGGTTRRVLVVLAAAVVAAMFALVLAARRGPAWYAPPAGTDAQAVALAELVEHRLVEEAQRVRPADEAWTLRITEAQANAWLALRLRRWIDGRPGVAWPDGMLAPQVAIEAGGLRLAMPTAVGVVRTRFAWIEGDAEGGGGLRMERVGLGLVPMPRDAAGALLAGATQTGTTGNAGGRAEGEDDVVRILAALLAPRGANEPIPLADGRRLSVQRVVFEPGAARITSRTLPRAD